MHCSTNPIQKLEGCLARAPVHMGWMAEARSRIHKSVRAPNFPGKKFFQLCLEEEGKWETGSTNRHTVGRFFGTRPSRFGLQMDQLALLLVSLCLLLVPPVQCEIYTSTSWATRAYQLTYSENYNHVGVWSNLSNMVGPPDNLYAVGAFTIDDGPAKYGKTSIEAKPGPGPFPASPVYFSFAEVLPTPNDSYIVRSSIIEVYAIDGNSTSGKTGILELGITPKWGCPCYPSNCNSMFLFDWTDDPLGNGVSRPGLSQFGPLTSSLSHTLPRFPFSPYSSDKAGNWGAGDLWPYSCYVDDKIHYWLAAGPLTWEVELAKAGCAHRYVNGTEHTGSCHACDGCASSKCCYGYCCTGDTNTTGMSGQCMPSLPAAYSYWTKVDAVKRTLHYQDGLYLQLTAPVLSGTWSAKPSNFGSPTKFNFTTADYAKSKNNGMVLMALDQVRSGFSGQLVLADPIDGSSYPSDVTDNSTFPSLSGMRNAQALLASSLAM